MQTIFDQYRAFEVQSAKLNAVHHDHDHRNMFDINVELTLMLRTISIFSLQGHRCCHIDDKCAAGWNHGEYCDRPITRFILSSAYIYRSRFVVWRRFIEFDAAKYDTNSTFVTRIIVAPKRLKK